MKDIDFNKAYKWLISNMKKNALFLWLGFALGMFADSYFYNFGWWVIVIGVWITYNIQLKYRDEDK